MHKAFQILTLLSTLAVAGITVHLHVRAHLRTYAIARSRVELAELHEARDVVARQVHFLWSPENVRELAGLLRQARERWFERAAAMAAAQLAAERT